MRNFRILFAFLAVLFVGTSLTAQSKKMIEKAETKVSQLNEKLTAQDADLALSEEQSKLVYEAYLEGLVEMKKVKKTAATKEAGIEASKPINKAMNKKIRKEILSEEQRKALNASKKDK